MKKIMNTGGIFVENETKRVLNIIESNKVSAAKKEELKRKVNILMHFYLFNQKEQERKNEKSQNEMKVTEKVVDPTNI